MYRSVAASRIIAFCATLGVCAVASANPLGPTVIHGNVGITTPGANVLQITNSPGSVVDWQSFSIGAGETTRFIQQNAASAILNRVTGTQMSELLGNLTSNGRVFLINGNGILVGEGATIDTAGLVMSTLNITNEDFLAGHYAFSGDEAAGSIVNRGYIKTAPGGEVILLAPRIVNETVDGVENSGLIETPGGELILAAGHAITITSLDNPDISFEVQSSDHEVVNLGKLIAAGGSAEILAGTIRHSGEINADSISVDEHGRVSLLASHEIETGADSVISANGAGDGGTIRIEAAAVDETTSTSVVLAGEISANGEANGGRIEVLGDSVALGAVRISADGASGGGAVRVGGDIQGADTLPAAREVTVNGMSRISADARVNGDGGTVAVWSEQRTEFHGHASARGGNGGGDGGFIEVSGKEQLVLQGSLDVGALNGRSGQLLLDPENITIVPGSDATEVLDPSPSANDRFSSSFSILPNGNILVRNQDADVGGLIDAGEILLFDPQGNLLGMLEGSAANERLGSLFQSTVADGNLVFRSPNAGVSMRGAVILFNDDTGQEIGRVSGSSANEQLGLTASFFGVPTNTYAIRSPFADVGGLMDAGALILVNEMTGMEIGRVSGSAAGDGVGSNPLVLSSNGNYFVPVPNADVGGMVDAGSLLLVNGGTGNLIGKVNGNNTNEFLGTNVNYFSFGPDALITSVKHNNGAFTDAGALIRVANVNLGGGNIERGRVMGGSTGELLGNDGFQILGSGDYVVFSEGADVGGFTDAGSIILADGATGNPIGRLDGTSDNEILGNLQVIESTNGNYWAPSPLADPGGMANAGTLYLVDGTTGSAIGQFDGDTPSEQLSATTEQNFNLGFDKLIVRTPAHSGDAGLVGLFDSVDLGGGNFLSGSVSGAQNGDLVGNRPLTFLSNGNYLVQAPNYLNGSTPDAGAVFVVDNASGNSLLMVQGDTANERLGDFGDIDLFTLGSANNFLIISPEHTGDQGAVFFVNGSDTASILNTVLGVNTNDALGSDGVHAVAGGVLIPVPNADPGGLTDAGSIFLVSNTGAPIAQQNGGFANDLFGQDIDLFSLAGQILVNDFNSDAGGVDSGRLVSLDPTTLAQNWAIVGTAGEQLGISGNMQTLFSSGNVLFFSPFEDTNAINAGRVILANPTTGTVIGSLFGQSANENLGNSAFAYERSSGNYFVSSTGASPGGIAGAGSVYLADGSTGLLIGQVDGTAAGEGLGSNINSFSVGGNDILITSTTHMVGGNANAGTVVQAAAVDLGGGNIIRGRIDGVSANEFFGSTGFTNLGNSNFVFRSQNADPGGRVDAGSVVIYDTLTGTILNRIDGAVAGDRVGSNGPVTTSNFNFFLPVPNADVGGVVDAGRLRLVSGTTGAVLGTLNGNASGEFLGNSLSFLSATDYMVRAPLHNVGGLAGAGAIFRVTNTNLGGGNIVVGQVSGKSANEGLGSFFPTFFTDTAAIASPNADPGGVMDAGSVVFFNRNTFAEISRVNGTSMNENFGSFGLTFVNTDLRLVRSPGADVGGLMDAGTVVLVNTATGQEVGRTNGISSGEMFGNLFPQFVTGGYIIRSPDADVGGLVDAGRIVQISSTTGLALQSASGISADERLGAFSPQTLADGRLLYASPDADVGGLIDAGRFAFFDPNSVVADPQSSFTFANLPGDDFFITNGALLNLLNGGASLTLQANNDITTLAGANIVASAGALTLQAGRSINLNAILSVPTLNLIANESAANGVDVDFRNPGTGDVIITGTTVAADTMTVSAENVLVQAGNDTTMGAQPALLFANSSLQIDASGVEIQAGYGEDAFAAIVSLGTLDINAGTLEIYAGDGGDSAALPIDSSAFAEFTGEPDGLPPFAAALAYTALNVNVQSIQLHGGGADNAFAALASTGLFNVTADTAELTPGEGLNADAVFLALGGIADIAIGSCIGCEQLFFDPLLDPTAQSGVYISGLLQDPSTDAILALQDRDDDDDDGDEEEDEAGECN